MVARADPVVYVASKLSGDIEKNVEATKKYSRFVIEQGGAPINPILNLCGVIDEETGRDVAMAIDLRLLEKADELWMFGCPSEGMLMEWDAAKLYGLPVRRFTTFLKEI